MGINYNEKLLDKFNLSLSCLDYAYIKSATNVKEVENILKILRSGEEGIFLDLIKFCENRLHQISPNNELLRITKKCISYSELPRDEYVSIHNDMKNWIEDIKIQEKDLKNSTKLHDGSNQCPIRNTAEVKEIKEEKKQIMDTKRNSFKTVSKPRSYEEWEKFDVDKEMEQLDKVYKQLNSNDTITMGKEPPLPFVDVSGLSETEKQSIAESEKTKGNEYFKAKDYVNSTFYYSRSLSAYPTAVAMCNRALAHMKMNNHEAAILDCDQALDLDPYYVKALYRRGVSYKELGKMQLAYMDFENALKLDPTSKEVQVQMKELSPCPNINSSTSKSNSVIIEEISSSENKEEIVEKSDSASHPIKPNRNVSDNSQISQPNDNGNNCNISSSAIDSSSVLSHEKKRKSPLESQVKAKSTKLVEGMNDQKVDLKAEIKPSIHQLNNVNESKSISHGIKEVDVSIERNDDKKVNIFDAGASGDKLNVTQNDSINAVQNITPDCEQIFNSEEDIMTPFKFTKLWHNLNAFKDSKVGATILKKIAPNKLPTYITNKLDANLLYSVILAIKEIVMSDDWIRGYEFLVNLINIPRIKTISLFLSSPERSEIENLLLVIEENQRKEFAKMSEILLNKV